jgi:hypothetical protein
MSVFIVAGVFACVRSPHRAGFNCGSVFVPRSVEVNDPAGTDPRPCNGAHDSSVAAALLLSGLAAITAFPVARWSVRGSAELDLAAP